jgi:hypothetical protein
MNKIIFASLAFVVGLVAGLWLSPLVFSPAEVKEDVKVEETAPVTPTEVETPAPVTPTEVETPAPVAQ